MVTNRQLLVAQGSLLLYKEGRRLLFCDRGSQATTARFVTGLIAAVLLPNSASLIFRGHTGVGLVLATMAAFMALAFYRLGRARRDRNAVIDIPPFLVVDLARNTLYDGAGIAMAPLTEVRFVSAFQFTSSSRALDVQYGGRAKRLFAANGLAMESPEPFLEALRQHSPALVA